MSSTLNIIYEDADCLVLNKPAGISVHKDGKTDEVTIADLVVNAYPQLAEVGEPLVIRHKDKEIVVMKPGIVHRLDKETSGVLLVAKTQAAHVFFKEQFQSRAVTKIYHAFVYGWPKEDMIQVDLPIGRDSGDIRRWTCGKGARGTMRDASTHFKVFARFGNASYDGKGSTEEGTYSFVEARPKTGRTHQIRVHLKALNHPIVADSLYAPKRGEALGFTRLALHARALSVRLPSGEEKTFIAPYPADFAEAVKVALPDNLC